MKKLRILAIATMAMTILGGISCKQNVPAKPSKPSVTWTEDQEYAREDFFSRITGNFDRYKSDNPSATELPASEVTNIVENEILRYEGLIKVTDTKKGEPLPYSATQEDIEKRFKVEPIN